VSEQDHLRNQAPMMEMRSERHFIQVIWLGGHDLEEYISDFASIHYFLQKCNIYQRNRSDAVNYFYNLEARPLRKWKIEDLVFTRSSIFSCDTAPVYTTQVLIHIDQKLRLVLGVSSVYLCQFVADVAFRRCSIRYRTFLESRCSLTSNLVRRSEGRHTRLYGHSSST